MFNELIDAGTTRTADAQRDPDYTLQGGPDFFAQGGGTLDERPGQRDQPIDQARLEEYEAAYREGGIVGQLVDARALMEFGVGTEWTTDDDDVTARIDGEPLTVADYLERTLPTKYRDDALIRIGTDALWAGNAFVERVDTRGGEASGRLDHIHPATIDALYDDHGAIEEWVQHVKRRSAFADTLEQRADADGLAHFALKRVGRNPLGFSVLGRAWDDVQRYWANQDAIGNSLERHGYTKWWVQVGREGGQAIDDQEIRRHRTRFQQVQQNDAILTGRDVEIEPLDTSGAVGEGISAIAENDLMQVAGAMGMPLEIANIGSDGLGTGKPAESRLMLFERQARAEQRRLGAQFVEQLARPLIRASPFPDDVHVALSWGDVVSDQQAVAEWLRDFIGVYTPDEIRQKLGDGPLPDDVDADDLGIPGEDAPEPGGRSPFDLQDGGGTDFRHLSLSARAHQRWERAYHAVIETALWPDAGRRQLFEFDPEEVPAFVKERLRETILDGAVFADFETIPSGARQALQTALLDSLEQRHGWSITSLRDNLQDAVPGLDDLEAERIARTETQHLVAESREAGYREQFGDDARFRWVGPDDDRTTDACEWIKDQVDADEGVPLEELKGLVDEANQKFVDHDGRDWTPHIQCRHTFVRVV